VGIQRLAGLASIGYIAGIDSSKEMVEQATARNLKKIEAGLVDLRSQDNNKSLQEKLPRHEFAYC
jgi:trans-aconitate methyltransferase